MKGILKKKKSAGDDKGDEEMSRYKRRHKSTVYLLQGTGCSLTNLHTLSTTTCPLPSLLSLSLSLAQTVQRGRLIGSSWMVRERATEAQRHRLASGWCVCIMETEIHLVSKGHASLIWSHTPPILTDFCCTHGKKTKALF